MKASEMVRKHLVLALALLPAVASALVGDSERGQWPTNWPKALEPFRTKARTVSIGTGIQQNIYEIRFTNRDEFERIWPTLLNLKSPGAPLTLYSTNSSPPKAWGSLLRNDHPAVRIYAPTDGYVRRPWSGEANTRADFEILVKEGKMLKAGPPWPAQITAANGALPEFVVAEEVNGALQWTAVDSKEDKQATRGFRYRARFDLDLVFDGQIIDLTRLKLPPEAKPQP